MNSYTPKRSGGFNFGKLIILGIILTVAAILGIQYLLGDRQEGGSKEAQFSGNNSGIFKPNPVNKTAPSYNPASRPEPSPNADSLGMFTKTNAGYAKEYDTETAAPAAAAKVKKTTAKPARKARAKKAAAAAPVIPKMKLIKGPGTSGAGNTALPAGAGIPDISTLIKNATQDAQSGR